MSQADAGREAAQRRMLLVVAIYFAIGQAFFVYAWLRGTPATDTELGGWLGWAATTLFALAYISGQLGRHAPAETRMHREDRQAGLSAGFWAAAGAALLVFAASLSVPVSGRQALHIVLSAGIAGALIRFGSILRGSRASAA